MFQQTVDFFFTYKDFEKEGLIPYFFHGIPWTAPPLYCKCQLMLACSLFSFISYNYYFTSYINIDSKLFYESRVEIFVS